MGYWWFGITRRNLFVVRDIQPNAKLFSIVYTVYCTVHVYTCILNAKGDFFLPLNILFGGLLQEQIHQCRRESESPASLSSSSHAFTFSLFQSFALFLRKEISRVRFIFTPRSLAPLTHSPILSLTPSLWPRPHKFWKYCYGWGQSCKMSQIWQIYLCKNIKKFG